VQSMKTFAIRRYALSIGAAALVAGCGGLQPQIGAPARLPQTSSPAARTNYKVVYSFRAPSDGQYPAQA
jgi:hypothetical protein